MYIGVDFRDGRLGRRIFSRTERMVPTGMVCIKHRCDLLSREIRRTYTTPEGWEILSPKRLCDRICHHSADHHSIKPSRSGCIGIWHPLLHPMTNDEGTRHQGNGPSEAERPTERRSSDAAELYRMLLWAMPTCLACATLAAIVSWLLTSSRSGELITGRLGGAEYRGGIWPGSF